MVVAGQPVYVMTDEWDEDEVPLDAADTLADGVTPRRGREGAVPHRMKVCGQCGEIGDSCGHDAVRDVVAVAASMLLCPGCGVRYDGNHSEYNKFFQVGTVGRATATDVLVTSMVNGLDKDSPSKRSVMAFTDNQQDSSFQAAHLQSLSRRFHMRRAIMQGLADIGGTSPSDAVPTVDVADAAFDAMDRTQTLPVYTRQTEVKIMIGGGDDPAAKRRYVRYLQAGVLMDTSGGPRKAQPNLEDTGLIVQDYVNFAQPDDLLAALRQHAGPDLKTYADAEPDFALDLLRAILDGVRRNRAIQSQNDRPAAVYMDPDGFETEIVSQLNPASIFHGGTDTLRRPVVYDEQRDGGRRITIRRLAGKVNPDGTDAAQSTSLTRWVLREQGWVNDQAARAGAKKVIREARDFLRDAGYLVPRNGSGLVLAEENLRFWRTDEPVGFRCPRCSARFVFRKQRRCPRCVKVTLGKEQLGRDDFFRAAYTADLTEQVRIEAEEHTGSVSGDERKAIETRFKNRNDALNVLVCTPTMELGVDIGDLSAVYMRNVPPSAANYTQRQGRAGRAAQPSTVVTFCSAQGRTGPHDQYFFRFPEQIVAGRIAAPRFLLDNEALLRSHLNAIVLGAREEDLPRDLTAWVRLDTDDAGGITAAFRLTLQEFIAANRDKIITRGNAAFADVFAEAESVTNTLVEQVVDRFVDDLDRDMAALSQYMRELKIELDELNAKADSGGLDGTGKRRRDAIERIRNDIRSGTRDYYPLSWLAQRGFLPTYAFPRQAVLLRFNDRPEARVRSRAIALREFAPGNSIYHRGKRYQVVKASFGRDARAVLDPLIICQCGTYLSESQAAGTTKCPICDTPLSDATPFRNAMHVVDGYAVQRDSVGADSEERLRQGYDIRTAYRLPATGVRRYDVALPSTGTIAATYVHLGHLVRVNAGLRRSNNPGFDLCQRCRAWNPDADHFNADRECAPASENLISSVVLMTQGQHDMVLLDVTAPSGADPDAYAYTLLYALQAGIATRYGIDQNELAGEVFPHPAAISDGRRLLIHEMDEGGVGVLSRVTAETAWRETTKKALAIVHVNSDSTEQDHACIDSCYQCLRTFYNQWHHDVLDRKLIKTFLLDGVLGAAFIAQDTSDDWDEVINTFDSETERKMIERLKVERIPAPDAAHLGLPRSGPVAEADLYWKADGQNVVVLLDGSVHDDPTVAAADATKRRLLRYAGFTVVIIRYNAIEDGIAVLGTKLGR